MTTLPYDILINVVLFLDPSTLVRYATVCRSLCVPTLRHLWHCPCFSTPDQLRILLQNLDHSSPSHPYHQWITGLIIDFTTFQPIPQFSIFQSFVQDLFNLRTLYLRHTYAVFSPTIQHYTVEHCMLEIPTSARSNDQISSSSSSSTLWVNLYFNNLPDPLPLTHLSITHTCITGMLLTDTHLSAIAHCCPHLQQVQLTGLFSDQGIIALADHCEDLQDLALMLPSSLVQSNTITHSAINELALSCPRLTHLVCLGQVRIDPYLAEQTLRTHCKQFCYCDFGVD